MPSLTHDALVQLFRNRPSLAPELLRDVLHTRVPAFDHVRIGDAALTEVVPPVAVAEAALLAAHGLDDERAKLYADLVYASVHEAARAILEALMASGTYEYQSDFARKYVAQGEASGRAHALLAVLAARGIAIPTEVRARIAGCTDLARLDVWLARAATATSAADLGE